MRELPDAPSHWRNHHANKLLASGNSAYADVESAASMLAMSVQTLRAHLREGKISYIKKRWFYGPKRRVRIYILKVELHNYMAQLALESMQRDARARKARRPRKLAE